MRARAAPDAIAHFRLRTAQLCVLIAAEPVQVNTRGNSHIRSIAIARDEHARAQVIVLVGLLLSSIVLLLTTGATMLRVT